MPQRLFGTPRRAMLVAAICSALIFSAFALAGYSFYAGHKDGCHSRDIVLNLDRDLLVSAQSQTDTDPTKSAVEKAASDLFVTNALARIEQARC